MSLKPTDFHLALEAVVAYADGELSPGAEARAIAHLNTCPQCSFDVAAQLEAKTLLVGTGGPELPGGLLSRLQQIPFTTDLQLPGMALAMHGENLQGSRAVAETDLTATAPPRLPWQPALPAQPGQPGRRPPGRAEAVTRPGNRRRGLSAARLRRLRRGFLGAMAGLAVGVLAASVAPVTAAQITVTGGSGTAQSRPVPSDDPDGAAASALVASIYDAITPRRFSGAATGLP